jgi:hypothetical protein
MNKFFNQKKMKNQEAFMAMEKDGMSKKIKSIMCLKSSLIVRLSL